jgi:hypothetical protein
MSANPLNISIARSIQGKFETLYDAYGDLRDEVIQLHSELQVKDKVSRELFSDLSRILAFSDQLHLTLSIMRDDVKAVESAAADPAPATEEWWEAHANEWLQAMEAGNCKVH